MPFKRQNKKAYALFPSVHTCIQKKKGPLLVFNAKTNVKDRKNVNDSDRRPMFPTDGKNYMILSKVTIQGEVEHSFEFEIIPDNFVIVTKVGNSARVWLWGFK